MKSSVVQQLQTAAQDAMQAQRVAYSSLWEAAASSASMLEIQRRLLETLKQTGHMSTVCLCFALTLSLPLSLPPFPHRSVRTSRRTCVCVQTRTRASFVFSGSLLL